MKKLDLEKLSYEINQVDLTKASKFVGGSSSSSSAGSGISDVGGNEADDDDDDNENNYVYNDNAPGDYYDDYGACVDYACADLVDFEAALAVENYVDFNDVYEIGIDHLMDDDYGSLA
ncbi:MAG: hypothetical protein AAGA66_14215 [Bacteroidota bacterium]